MVKNIIFDIGNVILNFNLSYILPKFTANQKDQEFILKNIINSPEWLGYALIDTGFLSKEDAIKIVKDRTNHTNDTLIDNFWNHYMEYSFIDENVLNLIKKLKGNYKIYLLSNINEYTYNFIKPSGLFELVDGYVLSYQVHKIKPHEDIYKTLIEKYNLNPSESLFIDDNQTNVDTANSLGLIGKVVKPDDYNDLIDVLKKEKVI